MSGMNMINDLQVYMKANGFKHPLMFTLNGHELEIQGRIPIQDGSLLNLCLHEFLFNQPVAYSVNRSALFLIPRPQNSEDGFKPKLSVTDAELVEYNEIPEVLQRKIRVLARLIQTEGKGAFVAHTGAGISTAAKIPDFRGPQGVWTRRDRGLSAPACISMEAAIPTFAHNSLVRMQNDGVLTYLVSQNVDGLHRRSGIRADNISELHGNCYKEICAQCNQEYIRDFDTCHHHGLLFRGVKDTLSKSGISHITGRKCDSCGGMLRDSIIHFTESLPELDLKRGFQYARRAKVSLCIGTSLHVTPAADVPFRTRGPVFVVNLQSTGRDNEALHTGGFMIHAKCDQVMELLMRELGYATSAARGVRDILECPRKLADAPPSAPSALSSSESKGAASSSSSSSAELMAVDAVQEHPSTIYVGNTHTAPEEGSAIHQWSLFVSSAPESVRTTHPADLIESVRYQLHSTFNPSEVLVNRAPFLLKCSGWGTFVVQSQITFSPQYHMPPVQAKHRLSFDQSLSATPIDLKN